MPVATDTATDVMRWSLQTRRLIVGGYLNDRTGSLLRDTFAETDDRDSLSAMFEAYARSNPRHRYSAMVECDECGDPAWAYVANYADDDQPLCSTCWTDVRRCDYCGHRRRGEDDWTHVNAIGSVCSVCLENNLTWCEQCDNYRGEGHEHACECVSERRAFAFPNDGAGIVRNDEVFTVELPAGTISDVGIARIVETVANPWFDDWPTYRNVTTAIRDLDPRWQTRTGNYTKRLARAVRDVTGDKVSPEVISEVGNIARANSSGESLFTLSMTRELNGSAAAFGNPGSCLWGGYASGRCVLKHVGAIGMRAWRDGYSIGQSESRNVTGRAWVVPLTWDTHKRFDYDLGCTVEVKLLTPTVNTFDVAGYLVLNSYGSLDGLVGARVLAHMTGMSYRKVQADMGPLYINGNTGVLVAPQAVLDVTTEVSGGLTNWEHS